MDEQRIRELVLQFNTTRFGQIEAAWEELHGLGEAAVPFLLEAYPKVKRWQGRASLVFYSIPFARTSPQAFELGLSAVHDRATIVRYRACMLLAYSLDREALPTLEQALSHPDPKTVEDARAAIDAIEHQNHHYFVDRDHTGRLHWEPNTPVDPEGWAAWLEGHAPAPSGTEAGDEVPPSDSAADKRPGGARGCAAPVLLALAATGIAIWLVVNG